MLLIAEATTPVTNDRETTSFVGSRGARRASFPRGADAGRLNTRRRKNPLFLGSPLLRIFLPTPYAAGATQNTLSDLISVDVKSTVAREAPTFTT